MIEDGQIPENPIVTGEVIADSQLAELDSRDFKIDLAEVKKFAEILKRRGARFVTGGHVSGSSVDLTHISAIPIEDSDGK